MVAEGAAPTFRAQREAVLGRPDLTGTDLAHALSSATDRWLAGVVDAAAGSGAHDVALLAVGGYGRGELAPGSDLDLVLVHRNRRDIARVADAVWYPIWDAGLSLDHSVRTAREVGAAMDADLRVALGLLDVRTVAGDAGLGDEIRGASLDKWAGRARRWLPLVAAGVSARHAAAGDLAFLLEPDLKEARGGLRDLHLLLGISKVTSVVGDLVEPGRLGGPALALGSARVELQRATGRPVNRLTLQDQDGVASRLGLDADELMSRLAAAARAVSWAGDDAWRRIDAMLAGRRAWRRRGVAEPVEPGIVVRDGEVALAYGADPSSDPTLALRAAAVSAELDRPLGREAIDRLPAAAGPPAGTWPPELRDALLRLLGAGRPAISAWETLDQQGVMERLLPEWGAVRSRPQRNAYHRFTVDRHLLETVAHAAGRARRVARPDLLLLAALLHDIGKGYPGDHTDAGVELVGRIGPRLGLPAGDVAVLGRLVRLHLLLPEAATRRDLDDPATAATVADAVGDRDTLGLLAALTEADSLATGPSAWGSWKAGLVATLVERVRLRLAGHSPPAPAAVTAEQQRLLAGGRLAVGRRDHEVTVVAPDRPGLLASVAGVLALDGAAVRSASTRSVPPPAGGRSGAMALLVMQVSPAWDELPEAAQVHRDLAAALSGDLPLEERLAERARTLPRRRPTTAAPAPTEVVVTADNAASETSTVLEVHAPDRLGMLWRVARALSDAGLSITAALVTTLGAEVVDAFYVQTAAGEKLPAGSPLVDRLQRDLSEALGSLG